MTRRTATIADAHAIFRRGLADLLGEAGIVVTAEAADIPSLIAAVRREPSTFAFVDAALVERTTLAQLREVVQRDTRLMFLVEPLVSSHMLISLLEVGASGCLERNLTPGGFNRSLVAVQRGEVALSRALTQRLCSGLRDLAERQHVAVQAEKLTPREREVLRYVSQAARNRDIAEALSISEHTVKRHVQNILQKLDLPTRVAAATFFERAPLDRDGPRRSA